MATGPDRRIRARGGRGTGSVREVSPKVTGATIGAALTTLVLYAIETIWHVDLPASVEGAILTLLVALVTFISGYLPEDPRRR